MKVKLFYALGTVLWLLGMIMYGYMILSLILILITNPSFKMNLVDFITEIGIIFGGIGLIGIDKLITKHLNRKKKEENNAKQS